MIIYFIVLLIVVLAVNRAQRTQNLPEQRFLYFIAFLTLVLAGGLRSVGVGTDSGGYVRGFDRIQSLTDVWTAPEEKGYFLLCWLGHFISDDYIIIFTLVAIVVTLCFLWGIRKYSVNPTLSIFVLITSGICFWSFNGIRQGIAVAIFFVAIGAIYSRKLWLFLLFVAIATYFHTSAIVTIPTYFLLAQKNSLKFNVLLLSIFLLSVVYFNDLIEFAGNFNERAFTYGESQESVGGLFISLFYFAMGGFFLFFKSKIINYRPLYDLLLNMFLLGLCVLLLTVIKETSGSGIRRLSMYLTASEILLWPIVFANIVNQGAKRQFTFAFTSLYLIYYGLTLQKFSNMVPYSFNPLVSSWFNL